MGGGGDTGLMNAHSLNTAAAGSCFRICVRSGDVSVMRGSDVCLTIGDKPASSSRDEDVKLEGCRRMRPGLQLRHPPCREHAKL